MPNQGTAFVTSIEELIFDAAPDVQHRQFLTSNGFIRTGKVWKRIRQLPAKRADEIDLVKAIETLA